MWSAVGVRVAAGAAGGGALVLAAGLAAGAVRLLPWLLAPDVPLRLAWPFAAALLAAAVDAALLLGVPLGVALWAARAVERGEARALFALGASPLRVALEATGPLAIAVGVAAAAGAAIPDPGPPGRLLTAVVEEGRRSCAAVDAPRSVAVPLAGLDWVCFPGRAPRAVGAVPGTSERAWLSATEVRANDALTELGLRDLELALPGPGAPRSVAVSAREATVSGLPGWGRAVARTAIGRAADSSLTALVLGLVVLGGVLWAGAGRAASLALAGGGGLLALGLVTRLDRAGASSIAILIVPAVAGLAVVLGAASLVHVPRRVARVARLRGR
ncbi:MAG: hypothetical protein IT376_00400 [Polyangiaceae bacterium]|nr:hypothetical protein [Polyangiaceae bacterium]